MTDITLNSEQLKDVIKSAILELLHDNKEEVYQLVSEVIEDMAIGKAIEEGEMTEIVNRESIFKILEPEM